MTSVFRSFVVAGTALALSACAGFGDPINQGDTISPEERRLRDIESKIELNERKLDNIGQAQISQQGPMALADELRELRGEVEKMRFDLDRMEQRNRQLYQDLDRRLVAVEGGTPRSRGSDRVSSGGVVSGGDATASAPTPRAPAPSQRDPAEEKAYLAAFDLLKQGEYADAILGFDNVVQNWPNGRYADTALYWSGESHYVQRNYQAALEKFSTLLSQHPGSSRVPDALLKSGFAHEELGQRDKAIERFQTIVDKHGDSSVANLAKQRLQRLRQQG